MDKIETLAASLAVYCTTEDAGLPREQFLRMIADRINDDLPRQEKTIGQTRKLVVATADYWWQAAYQNSLSEADRRLFFTSAVNHLENALIAVVDNPTGEFAERVRSELKKHRQEAAKK